MKVSKPGLQGYSLRAGPFTEGGRVETLPITVLTLEVTSFIHVICKLFCFCIFIFLQLGSLGAELGALTRLTEQS